MRFSICLLTHKRFPDDNKNIYFLRRAINSVLTQTFQDWELVLLIDGKDKAKAKFLETIKDKRVNWYEHIHRGRYIARNEAMLLSNGEWITWMDDDDFLMPIYLEAIDKAIKKYPNYKVFHFGATIIHDDYGISVREVGHFEEDKIGFKPFSSGRISTGSFVFHRSVYEDIGEMPNRQSCWDFAEAMKQRYPELRKFFPGTKELGNPYGDDFAYFYMITRKYKSKELKTALYIVCGSKGREQQWK